MNIKEIADYLDKVGLQYMAPIGLDSKPKVRPVQYMVLHDKKLWFCTNSEKAMYKELQEKSFYRFVRLKTYGKRNRHRMYSSERKSRF